MLRSKGYSPTSLAGKDQWVAHAQSPAVRPDRQSHRDGPNHRALAVAQGLRQHVTLVPVVGREATCLSIARVLLEVSEHHIPCTPERPPAPSDSHACRSMIPLPSRGSPPIIAGVGFHGRVMSRPGGGPGAKGEKMRGLKLSIAASVGMAMAAGITPAHAAGTTTITVWFDCEGCEVRAVNARDYFASNGMNDIYWKSATVEGGTATLRVPTSTTKGMAFEIVDMPYGLLGGTPTVALKRRGKKGSWCWAGTNRSTATLRFSSKRWIDDSTPEAAPGHYNLAVWATPSVKTWHDRANMHRLQSGGLGQQNQPACESR